AEYSTTIPVWCYGTSVLTETAGIIDDGSGPFNYNSGANCFWIILVPDAYKYTLSFNKFSTEAGNDILRILKKNNQLVAELSGNTTPAPIEIQSEMVVLAWSTNSSVNDIGWEISYTTELVNVGEDLSIADFTIFPNPASEQIQVSFSLDKPQDVKISIIDITGKEVYAITKKQLYGNQSMIIPLFNIDRGVYLLKIYGEQVLMTKKVVVR
ncbi:MAG: T9SS type A sorting domain-containing protein, partial [Candidatus Moranbacteria bacterium]|nr:T9SS type A sorting domain-containing protein [Candidatus Moranbacteria bacterium]